MNGRSTDDERRMTGTGKWNEEAKPRSPAVEQAERGALCGYTERLGHDALKDEGIPGFVQFKPKKLGTPDKTQ